MIEIGKLDLGDVLHVCKNMRRQDWEEVLNLLPKSVTSADTIAMIVMNVSKVGYVAKLDGQPVGVIQISEILDGTYRIGMFGTNQLPLVARDLAAKLAAIVPELIDDGGKYCEALADMVHEEAHKFLEFVGFTKRAILPGYGSRGRDVALFIITKEEANVHRNGRWRKLHTSSGASVSPGDGSDRGTTGLS